MIRRTTPADADVLVQIAAGTGVFKPIELAGLRHALDVSDADQRSIAWEDNGIVLGLAVLWPVALTDRTCNFAGSRCATIAESGRRHQVAGLCRRGHSRGSRRRVLFIDTDRRLVRFDAPFLRQARLRQNATVQDFWADGDSLVVFRKALLAGRASDGLHCT